MGILERIYSVSPNPLQTVFLNAKALELYFERYGKKFRELIDQFDRNQWLSLAEIEAYQNEQLRRLILHAYGSVPYYAELMRSLKLRPHDFQTQADLHKLPVLTRSDVKKNQVRLLSTTYPRWLLRHGHTSGTTGSPLDFYYDIQICVAHHVADWRQKRWAGLDYHEPYASLQGRVIVPIKQQNPPFWRKNYINNQLFLSSFHLTEKNLPAYFQKLADDGIQFLEGYPSTVFILATFLTERKETFPLKAVLTSSETLVDHQRQTIERAFACKVFDFYGMAERAVYATECDQHVGRHLNLDYGIAEFLGDDGAPVSPGQLGKWPP
jgi:phenylacetate-CoA ligase